MVKHTEDSEYFVDAIKEFKRARDIFYESLITITTRDRDTNKFRSKMYEIIAYSIFFTAVKTRKKYREDKYYQLTTRIEEIREAARYLKNAARSLDDGESPEKIRSRYRKRTLRACRTMEIEPIDPENELDKREIKKLEPTNLYNLSLKIMAEKRDGVEEVGRRVEKVLSRYIREHESFLEKQDALPSDDRGLIERDKESRIRSLKEDSIIEQILKEVLEN